MKLWLNQLLKAYQIPAIAASASPKIVEAPAITAKNVTCQAGCCGKPEKLDEKPAVDDKVPEEALPVVEVAELGAAIEKIE